MVAVWARPSSWMLDLDVSLRMFSRFVLVLCSYMHYSSLKPMKLVNFVLIRNTASTIVTTSCARERHQRYAIIRKFTIWFQFYFLESIPIISKPLYWMQQDCFRLQIPRVFCLTIRAIFLESYVLFENELGSAASGVQMGWRTGRQLRASRAGGHPKSEITKIKKL